MQVITGSDFAIVGNSVAPNAEINKKWPASWYYFKIAAYNSSLVVAFHGFSFEKKPIGFSNIKAVSHAPFFESQKVSKW